MKRIEATLTGISPLLQHNERLADPTNKYTQELKTAIKSNKGANQCDEGFLVTRRAEWFGGLYTDPAETKVVIPVDWVLACLLAGAKKTKSGPKVKSGVFEVVTEFDLQFPDSGKTLEQLYADSRYVDYRGVGVNGSRVMRCRPRFPEWHVDVELAYDEKVLSAADIIAFLETAGQLCGMGDYRPRFGRFEVQQG